MEIDDDFVQLNALEMFLLVLVQLGLTSAYELMSRAGLGSGVTSPALKRLEKVRLLTTSTPGPRQRVSYAVTEKGRLALRRNLGRDQAWQYGEADVFDSLARGITLTWLSAGPAAVQYGVHRAEENLNRLAQRRRRDAGELRESMLRLQAESIKQDHSSAKATFVATAYRWLKAEAEAALFRLEADAVQGMKELAAGLPSVGWLYEQLEERE